MHRKPRYYICRGILFTGLNVRRKVAVIVDGPAAVPRALADEYDIRILPLHVIADGWDRPETEVDMDWLMERLRQRKDLPTTSTASIGETLACYEWAAERASSAISIHVSSAFSKAYGAAVEARALAGENLPGLQIETVDSLTAVAGELAIAMEAARLAMQGADFSEVVRRTYEFATTLHVLLLRDALLPRQRWKSFQGEAMGRSGEPQRHRIQVARQGGLLDRRHRPAGLPREDQEAVVEGDGEIGF